MQLSLMPLYGGGFGPALLQLSLFYYLTGALLHWVVPAVFLVQNIQPVPRKDWVVVRDAFYSLGPIAIKAGVWTLVEWLHKQGATLLYEGPVDTLPHVLYCFLIVMILDVLHDAWFYWTHRLLHWGPLYKHIHYIHHKSTVPCAFTGYSFHVIEALIVFANEVLVCWMFPMHLGLHRVYHIFTTAIHQGGHVGYEVSPFIPSAEALVMGLCCGLRRPCPALNTVQHHDLHHRYPTKHFSLYFTHWDRWCGTMHPRYDRDCFHYFAADKAADSRPSQVDVGSEGARSGSPSRESSPRSQGSHTLPDKSD